MIMAAKLMFELFTYRICNYWRLLQEPRVKKEVMFNCCTIKFIFWTSIVWSCDVVTGMSIWCIDNVKSVKHTLGCIDLIYL